MQGRRSFLLSAGALAAASTVGTVSASSIDEEITTETITKAFQSASIEGGTEEAERALRDLGLEPLVVTSQDFDLSIPEEDDDLSGASGDDQELDTEMVYGDPSNSGSYLDVAVTLPPDGADDKVVVTSSMKLKNCDNAIRNSWFSPDAVGIGYNDSDWAPVGTPTVMVTNDHDAGFTAEDVDDDALAGTVDLVNHTQAPGDSSLPDSIATLTGEFKLRDGGEWTTMWGSYSHTFSISPYGDIVSISGGTGGLGVELNAGASMAWSIAEPIDPTDAPECDY